jgi:hypothetical protein
MVLPDASRNRMAPKKCHSHTLAYLSISCSGASRCRGAPKFSIIQTELTPDVFLKFLKDNYMRAEGTKINIKLDKDNTHHKSYVLHAPFK